jgi:hypothetical protein
MTLEIPFKDNFNHKPGLWLVAHGALNISPAHALDAHAILPIGKARS